MAQASQQPIYTTIKVVAETLAVIVRVFKKMIDGSMYDLTTFDKFKDLTKKLTTISKDTDRGPYALIPLTSSEFRTCNSYGSHAWDLGGNLTEEEEDVMSSLLTLIRNENEGKQ